MAEDLQQDLNAALTPPDNKTSLTDQYKVDGSGNTVRLSLIFSPLGVATMTKVALDDQVLIDSQTGSIVNAPIGANKDIANKFLTVYSVVTVTGVTPVPADLVVYLKLEGGVAVYQHGLMQNVTTSGSSVYFSFDIFFSTQ